MTYDEKLDILAEAVENGASREDWEDLVDELELDIHPDTLRKAWSVSPYSGFRVMQHYKEKMANGYCSDEEIKKMDDAKWELYKERTRLQDARRELNKSYREEARFENLKEVLLERIESLPEVNMECKKSISKESIEAALLFSDVHYGLTIDTPLNLFNTDIAKERIKKMVEKTIYYCNKNNVSKLNLCVLGDCVSGVIHNSIRAEQEEDTVTQLMDFSEILVQVIKELKSEIPEVVVYSTWGNHDRIIANKKDSINRENLARIVPFYLKARLPDVKIIDSHGVDYIEAVIGNKKTVMAHGDRDSVASAVNNYVRLLGYVPEQIFLGHTHEYVDKCDCDTQVTVNGCIDGSDEYAMSIRKSSKPHQVLKIYDVDVNTIKLDLD